MEYRMILGRFKKGKFFVLEDNKIKKDRIVEDEINHLLSKGWKLHGSPGTIATYGYPPHVIYHLVKD